MMDAMPVPTMTPEKIGHLARPFQKDEHGFVNQEPYVLKSALRRRFSSVDPRWSNTKPEIVSFDSNLVVVRLGLKLCGIVRYGIGTKPVTNTKNVKDEETGKERKVPLEGYDLERNIANALKSAVSDALTRAAMEFNCGVYLKDAPKGSIKTPANLEVYLKTLPGYGGTHWVFNGGGERVSKLMQRYGLDWELVRLNIEPGKTLNRLSDTALSEEDYTFRLGDLWFEERSRKPATPISASEAPYDALPQVDEIGEPVLPTEPPTKGEEAPANLPDTNPFKTVITRIHVDASLLSTNDIFTESGPIARVSEQWLIKSIEDVKTVKGVPQRKAVVRNLGTEVSDEHTFKGIGNRPLVSVVGGPKLDAARSNPALVKRNASGQLVWLGDAEEVK